MTYKRNSWENIKEKPFWVYATFNKQEEINNSRHLCFPFTTSSLNDLLNFSINLIDDKNQLISFKSDEKKISILNFKADVSSEMNREIRPTKSHYQLKYEQVNFLLEDIEKNLEEYKQIVETKEKQPAEVKKKYCKEQKVVTKLLEKKIAVKRIYSKN